MPAATGGLPPGAGRLPLYMGGRRNGGVRAAATPLHLIATLSVWVKTDGIDWAAETSVPCSGTAWHETSIFSAVWRMGIVGRRADVERRGGIEHSCRILWRHAHLAARGRRHICLWLRTCALAGGNDITMPRRRNRVRKQRRGAKAARRRAVTNNTLLPAV